MNSPKRVHYIIYILITNNLATYRDILEYYSIYDVLDLYEICLTSIYNKAQLTKEIKSYK